MYRAFPTLLLLGIISCSPQEPKQDPATAHLAEPTTVDLDGLMGEWADVQDSGRTVFNEHWHRAPDGTLVGLGCVLSGRDTVFIEHLGILDHEGKIQYAATIDAQNSGEVVLFELVHRTDSLVFTNPDHDYPQRIVYVPNGPDAWNVFVSGTAKGMRTMDHYQFKRKVASGSSGS